MLLMRKIDYYGQLILVSCMLLSIPIFYFLGFGAGLCLLGCWQLISALANTPAFIHTGYKKPILLYWTFLIVDLSLIALLFLSENDLTENLILVIFWISIWSCGAYCLLLLKNLLSADRTSLLKK